MYSIILLHTTHIGHHICFRQKSLKKQLEPPHPIEDGDS